MNRTRHFVALLAACALSPMVVAAQTHDRIVSIGGEATEIVWALGAGDSVVAVDLSSTYPPEVRNLPQVGYVRQISPEGVLSMNPDLIVASGAFGPPAARELMERMRVPVVWLPEMAGIEAFRESVRKVAKRLDRVEPGEKLLKKVAEQLAEAEKRAKAELDEKPVVLFLLEPPGGSANGMAAGKGTSADALIRLAGGRNAVKGFSGFQPISRESLLALKPDLIFVGRSAGHGSGAAVSLEGIAANRIHPVPLDDLAFGPRVGEVVLRWNKRLTEWSRSEQK